MIGLAWINFLGTCHNVRYDVDIAFICRADVILLSTRQEVFWYIGWEWPLNWSDDSLIGDIDDGMIDDVFVQISDVPSPIN